ncbi:MAG: arylsulfatase [Myxococcales bacterium]|nr:arylsulfatase [Myxococcales bacterium]
MARIDAPGLVVSISLFVGACQPATTPSGEEDAAGAPPAAETTGQRDAPPPKNWQPRQRNVQPSKAALVRTEDVINDGKTKKPNILVMWGDDVGLWNISAYNMGMMGYETPNLDRIANEGMLFTDAYGENSCTAGRSAFITGQSPFRTGLLKVGLPGSDLGLQPEDPTIAELLKPLGYTTAQYGKNHLGDLDEHLPTNHGFDEFFGNLYHLNAEEEPENEDYPKDPAFKERFGPRGVIRATADGKIEDTGPLTKKRMETVDEEILAGALDFIERAHNADKPFFLWFNPTRMHIWTRLKPESQGVTGQGVYADGLVEHDGHVGQVLQKLDDLGITDNTIVFYSTDNGAEVMSWPDGGMIPFRAEKNTTWEGGFRVPAMVRWPGKIPASVVSNGILSHQDWLPTLLAAAGEPDIKEKLLEGHRAAGKTFKVHADGYNQLDMLLGNGPSARKEMFYFTDDGSLSAMRYNDWKVLFSIQEAHGFDVWARPFTSLRLPKLFNLRQDPFERASEEATMFYDKWTIDRAFVFVPAQAIVARFLSTFKDYPPRQKPASFTIDQVLDKLQEPPTH